MKRRYLALLLALVQCFSLLILPANATETEKPLHFTLAGPADPVYPGADVTVTVTMAKNPGIAAISMDPDYDDDIFELDSIQAVGDVASYWTCGASAVFVHETGSDYTGEILKLNFKVKENVAAGEYTIGLTEFLAGDVNETEVEVSATSATVVVAAIPVSSVTLDQTSLALDQGGTATLIATVLPENAADKTVTWTTSDDKVATVADGVVTAVGAGTATITAKAGDFSATCEVTVTGANVPVTGITLGSAPSAIIAGDEITLTATVTPDYATDKTVTWTTSNEAVATVDANGVVTAVGAGSVTITAAAGEVSATKTFKVYDNLYEVTVDGEAANLTIGKYDNSNTWYRIDVPAGTKTIGISGVGDLRFVNHGNKNPKNGDCPAGMTYEDGVLYMDLDTYTRNDSYMADHYGLTYDKYTQRSLEFWGSNNWKMTCFFVVIEPCEGAHTWVDATCTEPKHCSVCGTIEGEALGHDWVVTTPEVPAVCETPGTTAIESCQREGCTATQGGTTIAAPGHKWWKVMVTKEPTCDEDGEALYTCLTCPEGNAATKTEPIAALGHTWDEGEVTTQPTCTEKGVKTFHCTVCEDGTKTEEIPANGHSYVDGNCSVCEKMEPTEIPFTDANHTSNGNAFNQYLAGVDCLVVDGIAISDWTEWTGSMNKSITIYVDPVYKNAPVTISLKAKDGYTGTLGLFASPVTVNLSEGVGEYLARSNKIGIANFGCFVYFKLGECTGDHEWVPATCTEPKTCSVCGKTEGEALGHAWNEGTVTTDPTCDELGVKTFACTVDGCDGSKTEDVAVLGHLWGEGSICTRDGCGKSNTITEIAVSHPNLNQENKTMTMVTGASEKIDLSFGLVDAGVASTQVVAWFVTTNDTDAEGNLKDPASIATVNDGVVTAVGPGTVTITAKAVDFNGIALLADGEEIMAQFTLTVADPEEGYTLKMGDDVLNTVINSTISVPVTIGHTGDVTKYNAFDLSFTYDPAILELTSTDIEGMTVTDDAENGIIHVERYGTELTVGSPALKLTFKAVGTGETNVEVTSAKVDISASALTQDAPDAAIIDELTRVSVAGYTVTLDAEFKGESSVRPGVNYTFEAKNKNYDYTIEATIDGNPITVTESNGIFTITADQITGNVVINVTEKHGKTFNVTLGEDMTADSTTAQYMAEGGYIATLTKAAGYNYNVTVTIGGNKYTGFNYDAATGKITIPGEAITGVIVFNSGKDAQTVNMHSIQFAGEYGDIAEGTALEVANGSDYTLTINKVTGCKYTVTATMGGKTAEVIDNNNGTYTISNVTGDLVITIAKESDLIVEVTEYVTLDKKTTFLVTAVSAVDEGKVLSYDGKAMFYSNQYNAWSYLVITEGTLSVEDAKAKITLTQGEKVELNQTYNVNETANDTVDINDAQLVFDMYNNVYQNFDNATMQKFLKADVNGDKEIGVADVAAIVSEIINAK